ncbi:MAG TPA: molybdenum ABC transporter ATP-binding protein [Burkholderiaceae bacterium]|nr:molybdenum ABC transporter ATP-binding protein [Burkholderiaceae bacterium]
MIEGHLRLPRGRFLLDSGPFAFPAEGVTALFGRSGCGKSTLLRAIAGLDPATTGQLRFRGERWQDGRWALPVARRDIGFVFQDAALFPHLSVRGNLLYAIKRAPDADTKDLDRLAERVDINAQLDQDVTTLSGGQRQRAAIARALLMRPRLLCMDEPLSALDWRAKAELLPLIDELALETGIAVLYITHAPQEVERLASRVLFMEAGRVQRIESLRDALSRADSPLFAEEGPVSVLHGHLGPDPVPGLAGFNCGETRLTLLKPAGAKRSATRLRVLARDVALATSQPVGLSMLNQLPVRITAMHPHDDGRVTVMCALPDGQTLLASVTRHSQQALQLAPGQPVWALVKSVALMD